jgi:signal transduction histidine kinase
MRLLLVTSEPGWAEALRTLFPPAYTIVPVDVRQLTQNPALAAATDACLVAEAVTSPWTVETLKQLSAVTDTPLYVLADAARSQWEEAALFAGAEQIFRRPLRSGVIQLAISRSQRRRPSELAATPALTRPAPSAPETLDGATGLALWRDFSRLLGRAREGAQLIDAYVTSLRDVLRCGRVLLYVAESGESEGLFRCASGTGVELRDFEAFRLTQRAGIGHLAAERGTAIWRHRLRPEIAREAAAIRELMVFGTDLAIPIRGRGGLAALLLVGPRIAGTEYGDHEVTLLYHAVEAMAPLLTESDETVLGRQEQVRQSALLQALPIAAAIVNGAGRLDDANDALRALLGVGEVTPLAFNDFPGSWSAAISAAVQNDAASARTEVDHPSIGLPRKLRLSVRRLEAAHGSAGKFLVTLEETTPVPSAAFEADAHNMHTLLQRAGEQLSNEFRNALTPVDIMVQLSHDSSTSRGELERLSTQVSTAIHRLRRRIDDLAYLTKNAIIPETTSVSSVLRQTRERLDDWLEDTDLKRIVWLNEFSETPLTVDARAVSLAVAELVMNAVEACEGRQVTVTADVSPETISLRVRNSGTWAPPPESGGFRHRPFVSSKSTGVGLGVEVASRVAEYHGGKLVLGPVAADTIEAVLRVPRQIPTTTIPAQPETRVARAV